jgi:hypothetical protein
METVLKRVNTAKTYNADIKAFEILSRQITDIINQMKHLKLYAVESKILEQLQKGDFSADTKIFQTLGTLNPKDPGGGKDFKSSDNYREIRTKYDRLCNFKSTLNALNKLGNTNNAYKAYVTWNDAKKDLEKDGNNGEIAKLLGQRLDEACTKKIKTTLQEIKTIMNAIKSDANTTPQNFQDAHRLCEIIGKNRKLEALSTYIDDLKKGINIRQELSTLGNNLSVLKALGSSWSPEEFDAECQKTKKRIENLREQLKQISDNEITEALGRKLLEATDELQTAQNRFQIREN